jgi:protein phosphatase
MRDLDVLDPAIRGLSRVSIGPVLPSMFGVTNAGKVRRENEDCFLVAELRRSMFVGQSTRVDDGTLIEGPPQGWVLMVADGMGGHSAGEVASAMTIDALGRYLVGRMSWATPQSKEETRALAQSLRQAVHDCQALLRRAAQSEGRGGMGTTLTMAYVAWPSLFVVHVGDSRMYAYREGALHRVTRDHTLAQQLVESKVLRPEDAESSHFNNMLVNALGGDTDDLRVDLHHTTLFPGDVLLLCTDGLTKHVGSERLAAVLEGVAQGDEPEHGAHALLGEALDAGGTDNVSVVVARF